MNMTQDKLCVHTPDFLPDLIRHYTMPTALHNALTHTIKHPQYLLLENEGGNEKHIIVIKSS